jgi:hypothetical protein
MPMNHFARPLSLASSLLAAIVVIHRAAFASVDDAESFALQAAEAYVKEGFQVREHYWGGDLALPRDDWTGMPGDCRSL